MTPEEKSIHEEYLATTRESLRKVLELRKTAVESGCGQSTLASIDKQVKSLEERIAEVLRELGAS